MTVYLCLVTTDLCDCLGVYSDNRFLCVMFCLLFPFFTVTNLKHLHEILNETIPSIQLHKKINASNVLLKTTAKPIQFTHKL